LKVDLISRLNPGRANIHFIPSFSVMKRAYKYVTLMNYKHHQPFIHYYSNVTDCATCVIIILHNFELQMHHIPSNFIYYTQI